jgi:glycosyltransferase involved in cell wall biosynthesis
MRIGLDIQAAADGYRSGLYYHLRNLSRELAPLVDGSVWLLATPSKDSRSTLAKAFTGQNVILFQPPRRFYRVWNMISRCNRLDVLMHNMCGRLPLLTRGANAFLVPDLIPLDIDYQVPGYRETCQGYCETAVRSADVIITFSEHTRRDLLNRFGGPEDKVRAIPLAAGPEFHPLTDSGQVRVALAPYGLDSVPYVLCVSTIEIRKNHVALVRAFARMIEKDPGLPHKLVLVGTKGFGAEAVFDLIEQLRLSDRVRHLGYVESHAAIYAGADVFVFPSRYEGFGLPPLESMASGVPVLVANATSLPEVIGDAGILFDPDDHEVLSNHLHRILTDRPYRDDLSARGLAHAHSFTWRRTAQLYLDAFREGHQMYLLREAA